MGGFLVVAINIVFVIFLITLGLSLLSIYFLKKTDDHDQESNRIKTKMGIIGFIIFLGLFFIIVSINNYTEFTIINNNDISNWITISIEIAIGFTIAILIMIYSQFKGKEIAKDMTHNVRISDAEIFTSYISSGLEQQNLAPSEDISKPEPNIIEKFSEENDLMKNEEQETVNEDIKKSHKNNLFVSSCMDELLLYVHV